MSSFSSSSASCSLFANTGSSFTVTQEEFNMFHNIDRTLFILLVFNMGRDPAEAIQIMAFWMWLEQTNKDMKMVYNILNFPDDYINMLADEAVMALNVIQRDRFPFECNNNNNNNVDVDLPITQNISNSGVSLRFFHNNRLGITQAVTKIVNDVCIRAFSDIVQRVTTGMGPTGLGKTAVMNPFIKNMMIYYNNTNNSSVITPNVGAFPPPNMVNVEIMRKLAGEGGGVDPFDLVFQTDVLNNGINEVLSRLNLNSDTANAAGAIVDGQDNAATRTAVPADERTIFLTFSKGYPISENEEVEPGEEQPLYARLVMQSVAAMEAVLGNGKLKFNINGKHVWARKYVRKNGKSPGTSQPNSPAAAAS
ncbi:Rho guanine nucleotide exchange factor [Quillaja saponaria]|uniref:Rho guanine nucleotide exchange factor n=1 Tax=Quillaja saponaria TaxID=32244 RepID=A0AAD7LTK5_QUISA|nr:Rho guanine nucleotide exchange factor [Quillaja saponaria]